ncbi:hypothetical protein ACJIZ3_002110 [Penstemon smallii]|uniref:FG-GAP repeat-containing protein n=1 Tax=Penstemon smallii TaxID=265156 RepID=A0ABD3U6P6_9LAMI
MRKRDLAILMLSAFAIFFSLQHEGDISFKEAWFHLFDEYPIKYEADRLPPPIVADLNGDGKREVLVATQDAKIQVLEPYMRRADEGFNEASLLAEVSLLPDKVRIATGRRAVAMATGVINKYCNKWKPRKQVLVVVTSGWSVLCFDHNLRKLWDVNLQKDFPNNAHHEEIAISITNYTLRRKDSGLIIVGGRMGMHPHMHGNPFEEIEMAEKNAEDHRRSATEKDSPENGGMVDLRHFALYAFAGGSGELRWTRKNENIEAPSSDAPQLIPQHNYKLDVQALNSPEPGEFECRELRESILGVMPHRWDRREDTSLELTHFMPHKRKALKRTPGKNTNYHFYKPEEKSSPGKDGRKKVSRVIEKAIDMTESKKFKQPLPYLPIITNYTRHWSVPNVVIAHEKEGIEVVHLASGQTICKVHLQEGGLHADINGDGVLDHVQVVGANGAEQDVVSGSTEVLRPCWAIATSGVPVREQLFNASICHRSPFDLSQRLFSRSQDVSSLEVATPILIPRNYEHKHHRGSHSDVVFLTNRGVVTSYSPGTYGHDAVCNWQLLTGVTWSNLPSPSGMRKSSVVPTLKTFRLRVHDIQELILVAGDQDAVVLSPGGRLLSTVHLPVPPTHALVTDDFSNDGLTDLILATPNGVYGFVQTRQPGALFFSTLVCCLVIVMGVLFLSQYLNSSKGKLLLSSV